MFEGWLLEEEKRGEQATNGEVAVDVDFVVIVMAVVGHRQVLRGRAEQAAGDCQVVR